MATRAFPLPDNSQNGMTLLDYFAAAALTGLCASDEHSNASEENLARAAYTQAEAMMAERGCRRDF